MAINRGSNSRFIVCDSWAGTITATARPEIRRLSAISNFTATSPNLPVLVSRFHRAISAIIELIWNSGYELWKVVSAFWDAKRHSCRDGACPVSACAETHTLGGAGAHCGRSPWDLRCIG